MIAAPDDLIYPELSYQITGVLFSVHNELGPSYQEKYYQRALAAGFRGSGIQFREQVPLTLKIRDVSIGRYFADFLIDDKIVVEIKTVPRLTLEHYRQVDGYLKAMNVRLGLLVNFRSAHLTFKRILNPSYRPKIRED